MTNTFLIITSIAVQNHPVLQAYAAESLKRGIRFIVIGDIQSPKQFKIDGCEYFSVSDQKSLRFSLAETLPVRHYARKNIGYLIAMSQGAELIVETDDDNYPNKDFWLTRSLSVDARLVNQNGWINVYRYFTRKHCWPRGFSLQHIKDELLPLGLQAQVNCPIQQGLADGNPDVDAIYRLTQSELFKFKKNIKIALNKGAICPFNSQNTTWFKEAFPLLYLPFYCSFRMTDILRSFIAQRIAWTCDWSVLFHSPTVTQLRNEHDLMKDFEQELEGYLHNDRIMNRLTKLRLKKGVKNIPDNMILCYQELIQLGCLPKDELLLLKRWMSDIHCCI